MNTFLELLAIGYWDICFFLLTGEAWKKVFLPRGDGENHTLKFSLKDNIHQNIFIFKSGQIGHKNFLQMKDLNV